MKHNSNIDALHPPLRQTHVMPPCLSHGSLFSGIGGFDLAAQWMGWKNIFQVEKDDWCRKVLAKNFPKTERFADIKDFTGHEYTNRIDVISGGFPCQPFSVAGQRKGKDDDRYLWEEMLRVIATIKPTYVVGENVTGIIGLALDTVLFDLEAHGYTTETFIIPACSKNAWHRRDRVWIIAYDCSRYKREYLNSGQGECKSVNEWDNKKEKRSSNSIPFSGNITNDRIKEREYSINWEVEPELDRMVYGLSQKLDRTRRIEALGNAIVPQVALELFKAVEIVHWHGA